MMRVTPQLILSSVQRNGPILKFTRTKVTKRFLNRSKEESLPGMHFSGYCLPVFIHYCFYLVFQYASKDESRLTKIFTWGLAEHGALGERQFLKPITKGMYPY